MLAPNANIAAMPDDDLGIPRDGGEYEAALAAILRRFSPDRAPVLDHGPGWYPIIVELDAQLAAVDPNYVVLQVKEKFGSLRYYVHTDLTDRWGEFHALIEAAEDRSQRTCELCGAPGAVDRRMISRVRTLCDRCADRRAVAAVVSARRYALRTDWPTLRARWGTGWNAILTELRRDLAKIDPHLFVFHLLEVDGRLEIGWWPSRRALHGAVAYRIGESIAESVRTCQRCGEPADLQSGVRPHGAQGLCDDCAALAEDGDDQRSYRPDSGLTAGRFRHLQDLSGTAAVLVDIGDGQLFAVDSPRFAKTMLVERDGQRQWTLASAAPRHDEPTIGGAATSLILKLQELDSD